MIRFLGCLLLVVAAGCGQGATSSLTGTCSYGGAPIEEGQIRLFPIDGTPGHGAATRIEQGRYAFAPTAGLFAGEYLVAVSATRATGRMLAGEGLPGEPDMVPEILQYIPERYNQDSQLRITLKPGENEHDFTLSE
jgi:hypothetical protein